MTQTTHGSAQRLSPTVATLGVIVATLGFGLVPLFAKSLTDAGMAPHAVAFHRYLLAGVLLLPIVWSARRQYRILAWAIVTGVLMGLGWVGYVRAIEVAPVSTVGVLYMTYPVFTLIIAWLLFGDRPSLRAAIAAALILLSAILVSSPAAIAPEHMPALVISLAAPFGFGFGISVLVHKMTAVAPLVRVASVSLGSVIGLLPLVLATEPDAMLPHDANGWLMVAGIAFATALIPQLIYTICSPMVGTARTAMAGSVELPMMFLVGWLAFGEEIGLVQLAACAIVVGAIVLTPSRVTRNVANLAREARRP